MVFSIFYAIPIIAITYQENRNYGIILSVLSSGIAAWIDYLGITNVIENQVLLMVAWNFISRLLLFVIIAFLIDLLKKRIIKEQKVAEMQTQLVKEIHHRLSNNMATTIGFLNLQILSDKNSAEYLMPVERRLSAMLNIHKKLYQQTDLEIHLDEYVKELASSFGETYQLDNADIKIKVESEHITVDDVKAQSIGLLINELLINSWKYAFEGKPNGVIKIRLFVRNNYLYLEYKDNGIGFEYSAIKLEQKKGIGLSLIDNFVSQLNASMKFKKDRGICYEFRIPLH